MSFHPRIIGVILRKDFLSLYPLILVTVVLQVMDVLTVKLNILPQLTYFMPYLLPLAGIALIFSLFQLDSPVSLVDDWLCRPVPRFALVSAKLVLIFIVLYLSRALAMFAADLILGYSLPESLLEAFLLQDPYALLLLPLLVMTALVTATLVQGVGVLLGLFVLVFVIPTPVIQMPGPLDPGIGEALIANGMFWMLLVPAKVLTLILLCVFIRVVFRHRNILLGRILLVGSTVLAMLIFVIPMGLMSWETLFSLQKRLAGPAGEEEAQLVANGISLRRDRACFPAARLGALNGDNAFTSARQFLGVNPWSEEQLENAGAGEGAVTFFSQVEPEGLPGGWRAKAAYVQVDYRAGGETPLMSLRPALYVTGAAGGQADNTFYHSWLLPQAALRELTSRANTTMTLNYSMSLLEPLSFELAADGVRRKLPGLGWCGATLDSLNNQILVNCFSAGRHPALISAELAGVPASRVDGNVIDYAPSLVQSFTTRRVELAVRSPGLMNPPAVRVNAWHVAAFTDAGISGNGILGNDLATCPLPPEDDVRVPQLSSWNDNSPHKTSFITVDSGVQLEVLDWGGEGLPILLLPGLGATAHAFDDFAPLLARDYHVFALTRRGTGYSSKPDFGYGTETLGQDVVQVLNALGIDKAVLVGHSIAGEELTWLGGAYPDRVAGLVYLDAAYDRSVPSLARYGELTASLPPAPPPLPEELLSYDSALQYMGRIGSVPLPEGELLATYNFGNRHLAGSVSTDPRLTQAILAAVKAPRYQAVKPPALALYATTVSIEGLMKPWYDRQDEQLRQSLTELLSITTDLQQREISKFKDGVPDSQVIEIPDAAHWIFISNEAEVLEAIRRFIDNKVAN